MSAPVKTEDLTDEMILDLQAQAEADGNRSLVKTAGRALQEPHTVVWEHCRRLCAAAINARAGKEG